MSAGTYARVHADEYARLGLRAHALLAEVPLHDVWAVDLPGGGPGRTVADVRRVASGETLASANAAVRFLFALRWKLGRRFGWDREPPRSRQQSFQHRLSDADRAASLVPPGTRQGAFQVLYETPRESVAEIQNATVHAFSVFALLERPGGYRLYWAIHVRPIGRATAWYMRLIDPFRRLVVYPAALRAIRRAWEQGVAKSAD